MKIIHIAAECFPAAKVGGLADVVGALPKYLTRKNQSIQVLLPAYETPYLQSVEKEVIYNGIFPFNGKPLDFQIAEIQDESLGYQLLVVQIPDYFDRSGIYSYPDDHQRFTAFQIACLSFIQTQAELPDIIHCHDHHTGLIPFMMQQCGIFDSLKNIPPVLTIHNAQYQGWMDWKYKDLLPAFNEEHRGLLDWNGCINPLAAAIKCAWKVTTVSPSYLVEMQNQANGLEHLLQSESAKSVGILNGIDPEYWNPETDLLIDSNYNFQQFESGKAANKKAICEEFGLNEKLPLFVFIGRLVYEKGADILPQAIKSVLDAEAPKSAFFILGSGEKEVENRLKSMNKFYRETYNCHIGYNEKLAHRLYAAADFLLMPSRVEPCGLNQMYALRYGTIPIVTNTGGLKDTINDLNENGNGIRMPSSA